MNESTQTYSENLFRQWEKVPFLCFPAPLHLSFWTGFEPVTFEFTDSCHDRCISLHIEFKLYSNCLCSVIFHGWKQTKSFEGQEIGRIRKRFRGWSRNKQEEGGREEEEEGCQGQQRR